MRRMRSARMAVGSTKRPTWIGWPGKACGSRTVLRPTPSARPSRATILTGKYSHLNGVPAFNTFDGSQPTVAKYLHAAGYHTGMIGKWHLGSEPTGFDYWTILPGQGRIHDPAFLDATGGG